MFPLGLGTGKEQDITITASTNLNDDGIDEMVKAEQHAEEDKNGRKR